jgi:general stress protein 26
MSRHTEIRAEIKELRKLLEGIRVAMLTSLDEQGHLHSRPMWTQEMDDSGELWFFTSKSSHKVSEVTRDEAVCLSYADPTRDRYVSVTGRAELVFDSEKISELWSPAYKAWFPDGLDDPELSLIRVQVSRAEYWDRPGGRLLQLIGFVKAHLTHQSMEKGPDQVVLRQDDPPSLH